MGLRLRGACTKNGYNTIPYLVGLSAHQTFLQSPWYDQPVKHVCLLVPDNPIHEQPTQIHVTQLIIQDDQQDG